MLYDTLSHYKACLGLPPGLDRSVRFLAETGLAALADGRHPLDGKAVLASPLAYNTREAHRRYSGIQHLISGREAVGMEPLEGMTEEGTADSERNTWFYRGPTSPCRWAGTASWSSFPRTPTPPASHWTVRPLRKAVVKVRLDG